MSKHSKSSPRNSRDASAHDAPSAAQMWFVGIGLLAYATLFLSTTLPSLSRGATVTRAGYLQTAVLLNDELIADWCGHPPVVSLVDRVPVLAIALAIFAGATFFGWLLLGVLGMARLLTSLERLVFGAGVGLQSLSLGVLASGLVGWLGTLTAWIIPGSAFLALATAVFVRRRSTPGAEASCAADVASSPTSNAADWMSCRWLWWLVPFAVLIVLGGLLPPAEFDVREYHLQVPKEFWQAGRIDFVPHNVYGNMPLGAEMFSLLAMAATNDWWTGALVGKTIIALFALLTALALVALGERLLSRTAGIAAALIYLSTTWVVQVSSLGLIDGVMACYALLAIYATLVGTQAESSRRWLILAGFLAGATVACKYTGLLYVVPPLAAWVCWRRGWRAMTLFALAAIASCGLWLFKNAVFTGNPFYPLLANWLGGTGRTPELDAQWRAVHLPHEHSVSSFLAALAQVTWRSEWLSIVIVPFALLGLTVQTMRKIALPLAAWIAWVVIGWWAFTHRIDRFLVPALPAAALLAGIGFCWSASIAWRRIATVALLVSLAIGWLFIAGPPGGYPRYLVSYHWLRTDPERVSPLHTYLNQHAAPGSAVLAVGEAQVFDIEPQVYYNTVFNECLLEAWLTGHAMQEFHAELAAKKISHVLVNWSEIRRYRSPGNYGFTDFVTPELFDKLVAAGVLARMPKFDDSAGEVYRVLPLPPLDERP